MGERHAALVTRLEAIVAAALAPLGVELVEMTLRGNSRRRILRIDIDRAGPDGVNIDDCQRASHAIGAALDDDDPLSASYLLEVSSPGIDRPIVTDDDLRRNTGRRVRLVVRNGEDSVERRGLLVGREQDAILLDEGDGEPVRLPWEQVEQASQDIDL